MHCVGTIKGSGQFVFQFFTLNSDWYPRLSLWGLELNVWIRGTAY
jgi:hypothetical protein